MGQRYRKSATGIRRAVQINKPRTIRVLPITDYNRRTRYYMDGWPWPVPAWMRCFDGWTVRVALTLAALALAFIAGGAVALLRLLGRAR